MQKMLDTIHEFRFFWEDKTFNIGMSIGLIAINQESINILGEDSNLLLSAADAACYIAKNRGRNRFHVYKSNDQDVQQQKKYSALGGKNSSSLRTQPFQFVLPTCCSMIRFTCKSILL